MFENITKFFKKFGKNEKENSKNTAKERLHLVLAQDRANISADFLEMMKQEIIEVIKKYIDIDEEAIDVRMTNKPGEDGIVGAPALYANIPIVTIRNEARKLESNKDKKEEPEEIVVIENENNTSDGKDIKGNNSDETPEKVEDTTHQELEEQKTKEKELEEKVAENNETDTKTEDEQNEEKVEDKKENNKVKESKKAKKK